MLMLQAARLVHVTASVRIVYKVKMSNKRKQNVLDLDQKIALSMKLKGAKKGGLRSVETNS